MLSFLPKKNKQTLLLEYKLRITTAISFFVCVLFIIALVGLLPSYLNEKVQTDTFRAQFEGKGTDQDKTVIERKLSNSVLVEYLAKEIKIFSSKESFSSVISQIINEKQSNVSISRFSLNEKSVSISGVADTRGDLIIFQRALQNNSLFSDVNLPISDITKNIDASFTMDITIR